MLASRPIACLSTSFSTTANEGLLLPSVGSSSNQFEVQHCSSFVLLVCVRDAVGLHLTPLRSSPLRHFHPSLRSLSVPSLSLGHRPHSMPLQLVGRPRIRSLISGSSLCISNAAVASSSSVPPGRFDHSLPAQGTGRVPAVRSSSLASSVRPASSRKAYPPHQQRRTQLAVLRQPALVPSAACPTHPPFSLFAH